LRLQSSADFGPAFQISTRQREGQVEGRRRPPPSLAPSRQIEEDAMPFMSSDPKFPPPPPSGPALPSNEEDEAIDDADVWHPTPKEREAMVRDPELIKLVTRVLSGRVPDHAVEDVRQDTLLAASQKERLPADRARRHNYVAGIARKQALTYLRRAALAVEVEQGAEVEQVAEAVDVDDLAGRQLIERLLAVVPPEQQQTLECLLREADGEKLTNVAADVGVNYHTLRARVRALQETLHEHAKQIAGVLIVLIVLGSLGIVLRPKPNMGWDMPEMVTLEPAGSTLEHEPNPLGWARVLRGQAFKACMHNQWNQCLETLDAARNFDPTGDADPLVQAARSDAIEALGSLDSLKPGDPPWTPTGVRPYAAWAAR
jgi:DNA-directed RNA polymerase specialized sigma24 family protein